MTRNPPKLVPRSECASDPAVIRDAEVATELLRKMVADHPDTSAKDCLKQLQDRLAGVCLFQWDQLILQS